MVGAPCTGAESEERATRSGLRALPAECFPRLFLLLQSPNRFFSNFPQLISPMDFTVELFHAYVRQELDVGLVGKKCNQSVNCQAFDLGLFTRVPSYALTSKGKEGPGSVLLSGYVNYLCTIYITRLAGAETVFLLHAFPMLLDAFSFASHVLIAENVRTSSKQVIVGFL